MKLRRFAALVAGSLLAVSSVFAFSGATLAVDTNSAGGHPTINPCNVQTGGAAADLQNQCQNPCDFQINADTQNKDQCPNPCDQPRADTQNKDKCPNPCDQPATDTQNKDKCPNPCDQPGADTQNKDKCPRPTPSCDVVTMDAQGGHHDKSECPSPTPVVLPSAPILTCGGTVSFTGVPEGWALIIEPGDQYYTAGFTSIAEDPGVYTYEFRDAGANDMVGGTFTIAACATPTPVVQPPAAPVLTCGGTVAFTGVPEGWYLIVEPGDLLYSTGFASISLTPGVYTYEFRDALANDKVGGTFTIVACPTPSPTVSASASASPTASPTASATATPTGHGASPTAMPDTTTGSSGDSGSSPIILIGFLLLAAGLGFAAIRRLEARRL